MVSRRTELKATIQQLHEENAELRRQIADYKRAEHALRQSEQWLHTLANSAPVPMWITGPDGGNVFVNRAYCEFFQVTVSDVLGPNWEPLVHHNDVDSYVNGYRMSLRDAKPFRAQARIRRADGAWRWIESYGAPRFSERGEFLGHVGITPDITEMKLAELAVRENEARLSLALTAAEMGTWDWCVETGAVVWSDQIFQLLGYTPNAVVPSFQLWERHVHPADRESVLAQVERAKREQDSFRVEYRLIRADTTTLWVHASGRFFYDHTGRPVRMTGVVFDITERKCAHDQLRDWNTELERRVQERTKELVQSHERLRALAIEVSRAEDRERKRLARAIHEDLSQLLVLSKMRLERLDVDYGLANVRRVLTEVKGLLEESLRAARTMTADLRPPLLGGSDDLMAALRWVVDKMQRHGLSVTVTEYGESKVLEEDILFVIYQAVQELLWNVLKHAQTCEATICVDCKGEQAEIIVEDRGQGFDSTQIITPSKEGGFGLLNISERVCSVGGQFKMTSAPGTGTRAQIIVPMKVTRANMPPPLKAELQDRRSRGEESSENIDWARLQVLVVDDHPLMREAIRHVIEDQAAMAVIGEASDGQTAVQLARELIPDVIIMDVNLPSMNGIDATREIKRERPNSLVIGLSMYEEGHTAEAMRRAGASVYLSKGSVPQALCTAIRAVQKLHQ
jgi:PAS domain S-box-containing protein